MKKANRNTEYILLRAFVNSEWDKCSCAIIHVTNEWIHTTQKRIDATIPFGDDTNFYHLSYWDSPKGFYKDPVCKGQNADEIIGHNGDWCFIELCEGEPDNLPVPENYLGSYQLIVNKDGWVCYKAYGEYSGEEFYTFDLKLSDIVQKIQSYGTK
jgi:hypothetical protein